MTTEEGNELIAEFMGWQKGRYSNLPNKLHRTDYGKEFGISISDLKYHSSWNWLFPVVKKIQQIRIEDFNKKKPVMNALYDVDIEILWQSVVVFIQWYNSSKQNRITER